MSEERFETMLEMIKDKEVSQEVKINLILEMAYHGEISLNKAKELCTETGIFSDHWAVIDAKSSEIYSRFHKKLHNKSN